MVFLEDVGFVVSGGAVATVAGFVAQVWYARHRDRRDVKKIQDLLKPDFANLYQMVMKDKNTAEKVQNDIDRGQVVLHDGSNVFDVSFYLANTGGQFRSLVWPQITSSGKMLKMKKEEIEAIQLVQEGVIKYNNNIAKMQRDMKIRLRPLVGSYLPLGELNTVNTILLEGYLCEYNESINELLAKFKELKKLAWFDY